MKTATWAFVALYLAAIIAANQIIAYYGPPAVIYVAFFLIGLTLVVRDRLHDAFADQRLVKMAALIAAGSILSYVLNADAGRIALASFLAFAAAETSDALLYHTMRGRAWMERSNASNVIGAALDSIVFVTVAFGWSWTIIFGQFTAKVAGGLLFSFLLARRVRAPRGLLARDA